jgi:hypothetical protein
MKRTRTRKSRFRLSEFRKADIAIVITGIFMLSMIIGAGYAFQPTSVLRPDTATARTGAQK